MGVTVCSSFSREGWIGPYLLKKNEVHRKITFKKYVEKLHEKTVRLSEIWNQRVWVSWMTVSQEDPQWHLLWIRKTRLTKCLLTGRLRSKVVPSQAVLRYDAACRTWSFEPNVRVEGKKTHQPGWKSLRLKITLPMRKRLIVSDSVLRVMKNSV